MQAFSLTPYATIARKLWTRQEEEEVYRDGAWHCMHRVYHIKSALPYGGHVFSQRNIASFVIIITVFGRNWWFMQVLELGFWSYVSFYKIIYKRGIQYTWTQNLQENLKINCYFFWNFVGSQIFLKFKLLVSLLIWMLFSRRCFRYKGLFSNSSLLPIFFTDFVSLFCIKSWT